MVNASSPGGLVAEIPNQLWALPALTGGRAGLQRAGAKPARQASAAPRRQHDPDAPRRKSGRVVGGGEERYAPEDEDEAWRPSYAARTFYYRWGSVALSYQKKRNRLYSQI
jgi:hypothetical protein